ncbi:MAG: MotA/TolQ/ExbB proton channel family protein [Pseudomonadota bacterium]
MESQANGDLVGELISGIGTLLELGGPVVAILLAASVVGLALALLKFFQYSTLSSSAMDEVANGIELWAKGEIQTATKVFEGSRLSLASDIQFGLEKLEVFDADLLREELLRRGAAFIQPYASNLRPLELIYYLAPVLGLLGTVLGMIDAFRGLAVSSGGEGESSALAGGIWEALLTTAVGLSIAIPFAVMHALLESRLGAITDRVADLLTRVQTIGGKS